MSSRKILKYFTNRSCASAQKRKINGIRLIFCNIPGLKRWTKIDPGKVDGQFNNGISLALPSYHISSIRCRKLLKGRNLLELHALSFAGLFHSRFHPYDMCSAKIGVQGWWIFFSRWYSFRRFLLWPSSIEWRILFHERTQQNLPWEVLPDQKAVY